MEGKINFRGNKELHHKYFKIEFWRITIKVVKTWFRLQSLYGIYKRDIRFTGWSIPRTFLRLLSLIDTYFLFDKYSFLFYQRRERSMLLSKLSDFQREIYIFWSPIKALKGKIYIYMSENLYITSRNLKQFRMPGKVSYRYMVNQ